MKVPDSRRMNSDMTISLPGGRTVNEFVELVIQSALAGNPDAQTEQALVTTLGISPTDAALVRDRVFGGIVRAATGNAANRPDQTNDPFACGSYDRAIREDWIIAAIYPQFARRQPPRRWWQFWRKS
jgi:hypothetical protein